MEFQTRSETNGIQNFTTMKEAYTAALIDPTIWKISFSVAGERIRLIRGIGGFKYEPIEF